MSDTYTFNRPAPDDFIAPQEPPDLEEDRPKRNKPGELVSDPDQLNALNDLRARANVVGHQDTSPDDYAKSIKVAQAAGVHPDAVNVNRQAWERDQLNNLNSLAVVSNNSLKTWVLEDPKHVQISRDDIPTLDAATRYLKEGWQWVKSSNPLIWAGAGAAEFLYNEIPKATEDVKSGYYQQLYGKKAYEYIFGSPEKRAEILPYLLDYEESLKTKRESGALWVSRITGEFLGAQAAVLPEAFKYGLAGASVGAIASAATGPAAPATAPLTAGAGFTAGMIGGISIEMAQSSAGSIYRTLDLARDQYGQPIDETTKQVAAIAGGLLVGVLGAQGGNLTAGSISQLMTKLAGSAGIRASIAEATMTLGKYGAQGAALNVGQTLAENLADQLAKVKDPEKDFKTIFNDPEERAMLFDKVKESAAAGGLFGSVLAIPHVAPGRKGPRPDHLQVIANQNRLDKLMEITSGSKARERDPGSYEKLIDGTEKETFSIPADVVLANKDAFKFLPDLEEQLQRSAQTGTDVKMTVGQYVSNVPPELHAQIRDHVSQGDTAKTPAEVRDEQLAQQQLETPPQPQVPPEAAAAAVAAQAAPSDIRIPAQQLELPGINQRIQLPEIVVPFGRTLEETIKQRLGAEYPGAAQPPDIKVAIQAQNILRIRAGLSRMPPEHLAVPDTQLEFSLVPPQPHVFPPTPERIQLGPVSDEAVLIKRTEPPEQTIQKDPIPKAEAEAQFLQDFKNQVRSVKTRNESILELAIRRDPKTMAEFHRFIDEEAAKVAQAERDAALRHTEQQVEGQPPSRIPGALTDDEMASIWGPEKLGQAKKEPKPRPIDTKEIHAAADAAEANWNTRLIQAEGADTVRALEDPVAKQVAQVTGEKVEQGRKLMWLDPLFESPKALGMTVRQFANYSKHIQEVQRRITQSVWDAANKLIKQKETKRWKELGKEIGPEVADAVARRPEILLADFLTTGKVRFETEGKLPQVKLDRADVDALFTREELTEMGIKKNENVSDHLPSNMFRKEGTISADDLASLFQQGDGKSVIRTLIVGENERVAAGESRAQRYNRLVREGVNERLTQEHGNFNDIVLKESMDAVVNVAQLEVLSDEVKALGGKAFGDDRIKVGDFKRLVEEDISTMPFEKASKVESYQALAGRWGKKAELALLSGDYVGAFKAKQNQLMAYMRSQKAIELRELQADTNRLIRKYGDRPRVESVNAEYNTRIIDLLKQLGVLMGRARDEATITADIRSFGKESIHEWIAKQQKEGEIISQPTFLIDLAADKVKLDGIHQLRVDQFQLLNKVLTDLDEAGTRKGYVESASQKWTMDNFVSQVEEQLVDKLRPQRFRTDIVQGKFRAALRSADASLIKVETLLHWLDRFDPDGAFTQVFFRPFKEAQAKAESLQKLLAQRISESVPVTKDLNRMTENTWLHDSYGLMPLRQREMYQIAGLFWSNEPTRKKLLNAYKWDAADVEMYLWTNLKSEQQWNHLDTMYRVMDDLHKEKDKTYRAIRGYGMEAIEPITFADRWGNTRTGGYWPVWDAESPKAKPDRDSFLDRNMHNPLAPETTLHEQMVSDIIPSLNFEHIGYRINEIVHDVSYRSAVLNAKHILEDGRVLKLIQDSYGAEYGKSLNSWLRDTANDRGWRDEVLAHWWLKTLRYVGSAAITNLVGFNPATAVIHSTSAGTNTLAELQLQTIKGLYKSVGDKFLTMSDNIFRNPENTEKAMTFAWDNSPELRSRWNKDMYDVNRALGHWSGLRNAQWVYQRWAQSFISYTDYMTAVVAWHGRYHQLMEEGRTHEDAVFTADQTVRQAHGGVSQMDKAAIQRATSLAPFVMFYGYFNHNFNQFRTWGNKVKEGTAEAKQNFSDGQYKAIANQMTNAFWTGTFMTAGYLVVPALIHAAVREPPKKEGKEESWPAFMGKALALQTAGGIPIMRDMAYAYFHPESRGTLPTMQMLASAGGLARAIKAISEGEQPKARDLTAVPSLFKFGSRYIERWVDTMAAADQDGPRNTREWKNMMLYGQPNMPGEKRKKAKKGLQLTPRPY